MFGKKKLTSDVVVDEECKIKILSSRLTEFNQVFSLYVQVKNVKDINWEAYYNRCLRLLSYAPDLVYMVDENGKNIIEYMLLINEMSLFLDLLKESEQKGGAGIKNLLVCKYGQKEPLCFSVLQSSQVEDIVKMDNYIKEYDCDPINASKQKWSKLTKQKMKSIEENENENRNIFNSRIKPILESLRNVQQENQRKDIGERKQ